MSLTTTKPATIQRGARTADGLNAGKGTPYRPHAFLFPIFAEEKKALLTVFNAVNSNNAAELDWTEVRHGLHGAVFPLLQHQR